MSCLNPNFTVHESSSHDFNNRAGLVSRFCSPIRVESLQIKPSIPVAGTLNFSDRNAIATTTIKTPKSDPIIAQPLSKSHKWWEKSVEANMVEIQSAFQLVHFLQNSGDTLVVLSFYSPGCGGCRTLHPKICQMAEMNPKALFLKINHENHKAMCHALNVHVLPFFKFYRGAEGRLCSFSCTNATINKFKVAMSKHSPDRCSLGPAKGLSEEEMASLASQGLISSTFVLDYGKKGDGNLCVIN